ncbi:MAG: hypothetical protein ABIP20_07075 [Chthoniobacteraceae bacterium]
MRGTRGNFSSPSAKRSSHLCASAFKGDGARGEPEFLKAERGYTKHDLPGELFNLREDLSERRNHYAEHPDMVRDLKSLLEKYRADGRSTPGAKQSNDMPIGVTKQTKNPKAE